MKLSLLFLFLLLFSLLAINVNADTDRNCRYYNPYYYYRIESTRYLVNRDFGNTTIPLCYDPEIRTQIAMSNPVGFGYCAENYWYRNENKNNPVIQYTKAIIQWARYGDLRQGRYFYPYGDN